ncbi:MAG: hypothetical protein DRR04_01850 [Gammaproteobacteria bacterium]|nr:MAG: hypothetical protein DRQ97_01280 [Gammaproteobacteria bacterium]RLA61811.1 MAG: hypothetical protein DRR04_01850 [Gammaproteobacteria bacterium]
MYLEINRKSIAVRITEDGGSDFVPYSIILLNRQPGSGGALRNRCAGLGMDGQADGDYQP